MKRLLFLALTGSLALLFVITMWQDTNREWTRYQRQFVRSLSKDERRGAQTGIRQLIVPGLERVDRCTTCHMAIDKPQLALAEEPFTAHPGQFLAWHPPEKFGCTVCHGGQGLATETAAAHGDVKHWEEPLLRGDLVQASCRQCHGDLSKVSAHVPLLSEGKGLFQAKGCYGCHAVKDVGQTVSVDLTEVGSKSYLLLEADFEMMEPPHDRIHWLMAKLDNPRHLNPGVRPEQLPPGEEEVFPSAMPNFNLSDSELKALTVYLLSLKAGDLPASFVTHEPEAAVLTYASPVEWGKAVYEKVGCTACHGIGGSGGRHNWNAALGTEVPPLTYVRAYYGSNVEALKALIRDGRQPAPRGLPNRPRPPLYMPAWKDRISEQELDALVAYLFSLSGEPVQPAAPPAPAEPAGSEPPAPTPS